MRLCWLVIVSLASLAAAADGKKARAAEAADAFFDPERTYDVHVHLTAQAWQLMQPERRVRPAGLLDSAPLPATRPAVEVTSEERAGQARRLKEEKPPAVEGDKLAPCIYGFEYVYVKAAVELDGQAIRDVGVRFKGNSSYENYQNVLKRPLKLDFDRFVPGQKFRGVETLNLSNNAFDATSLREAMSYYVYRMAGLPAPRTAFANVYLTVDGLYARQWVGLYTIVEEVDDKAFLKSHFADAKGLVFKPEGMRGLPYLGENFEPYVEHYRAKRSPGDPGLERRFVEFTRLVNYADDATFNAKIKDYLDVDAFIRYTACTVLIADLDSPLVNNHNYYLYLNPADARVTLIPWDMNLSFDSQVNLTITRPWHADNRLFQRVMSIDGNESAYAAYVRKYAETFFGEDALQRQLARFECALLPAHDAAAAAGKSLGSPDGANGRFGYRSRYPLEDWVTLRLASVRAQLDGKPASVYTPHYGLPGQVFRWGLNAGAEYGMMTPMAAAARKAADADGDYKLSGREVRDAAAALFYDCADRSSPPALTEAQLAAGLVSILAPYAPQDRGGRGRGFLGFGGNRAAARGAAAAALWARAIFRDADDDHDAKVTLAELSALARRVFCVADRDQEDKLDEREVAEGLDSLAAPPDGWHANAATPPVAATPKATDPAPPRTNGNNRRRI
jgi:hypothetical protein